MAIPSYIYNLSAGKDLVSVDQILARYLWDQDEAPLSSELHDEKWIRENDAKGKALEIDKTEYMTQGAGVGDVGGDGLTTKEELYSYC